MLMVSILCMDSIHLLIYFRLADVGGQIHERSTWEGEFQDVVAVLYMVSLSGKHVLCVCRGTS